MFLERLKIKNLYQKKKEGGICFSSVWSPNFMDWSRGKGNALGYAIFALSACADGLHVQPLNKLKQHSLSRAGKMALEEKLKCVIFPPPQSLPESVGTWALEKQIPDVWLSAKKSGWGNLHYKSYCVVLVLKWFENILIELKEKNHDSLYLTCVKISSLFLYSWVVFPYFSIFFFNYDQLFFGHPCSQGLLAT